MTLTFPKLAESGQSPVIQSKPSPWLTPLMYALARWLVLPVYFGKIKVTGREYLPREGAIILAPTHRSRWDAIIVPYAAGLFVTGRHPHFMVTADEVKGLQGWFIRRLGGFAIDTKNPGISSLRHGVDVLQAREMLVIFPEGNIFRERDVVPLKPGMARLALQAEMGKPDLGIQIIPISIRYSDLFPHWRTRVEVHIGPPLKVQDYCCGIAKKSAQKLTQDLEETLTALAASHSGGSY